MYLIYYRRSNTNEDNNIIMLILWLWNNNTGKTLMNNMLNGYLINYIYMAIWSEIDFISYSTLFQLVNKSWNRILKLKIYQTNITNLILNSCISLDIETKHFTYSLKFFCMKKRKNFQNRRQRPDLNWRVLNTRGFESPALTTRPRCH